jgi:hypothetical protein
MPAMSTAMRDAALAAGIFVGALAWFALQPRNLGPADESFFLVEAMRMAGGERLYTDLFWFGMPGGHWLLAGAFSMFGASIAVAKMTMGVVNAISAALTFAAGRALAVRPALAVLPALAFLALAQPAWPYVSDHWMSTTLILAVFLLAVSARALEERRRLVGIGLALGILGAVYQQKAPVIAVGVGVAILLACGIRRDPAAPPWFARLALVTAGVLLVIVPVLALMVATVDPELLIDDLIRFPLVNYRQWHQAVTWGAVAPITQNLAAYVWPPLLAGLPLFLLFGAAGVAAGCRRGWARARVVQWSTALLLCGAAALAIGYNDDFIHIAFVAAPFFVLAALLLETGLALVPERARPVAGALLATAIGAGLLVHLAHNAARMRAEYAIAAETHFGRVDFHTPQEVALSAMLERHLDQTASRVVFAYPSYAAFYLTAGGHNPTRYQFLHPALSPPEQLTDARAVLEAKEVPLVIAFKGVLPPDDPIIAFLATRYDVVEEKDGWTVYRRRSAAAAAADRSAGVQNRIGTWSCG